MYFYQEAAWLNALTVKSKGLGHTCPAQRFVYERTHCPHPTEQGQVMAFGQELGIASSPEPYRARH